MRIRQRRLRDQFWIRGLQILAGIPGAKRLKYLAEKKIIQQQCCYLFADDWYREFNPDVAENGRFPLMHFIKFGLTENRNPHPLFDMAYYRRQVHGYPKEINPLVHYQLVGRYQRLSPTRWFDADYYLAANADVHASKMDPFEHFVKYGVFENRSSTSAFSAPEYVATNPDVARSARPALLHYLDFGMAEGRAATLSARTVGEYGPAIESSVADTSEVLEALLAMAPRRATGRVEVDIVIPVYRELHITLACILSVLKAPNDTVFDVVVIDDCSPDPDLSATLQTLERRGLLTLIRHDENKGFVHSANLGIRLHPDRDVVLLNSDTEVFCDWIDRLRTHAASRDVATVSPLTNSGTICSYPYMDRDNALPTDCTAADLDAETAWVNAGIAVETPTGVGFCLYMARSALDRVGDFDEESFGMGYGEENDFCMRAQVSGFRNKIAADVFVYHLGSASFQGEKVERVAAALRIVNKRYPGYDKSICDWIANDPLQPARKRLDTARLLRLAVTDGVLIVSHQRGGGTEQHIQERIVALRREEKSVFRMSPNLYDGKLARLNHAASNLPNLESWLLDSAHHRGRFIKLLKRLRIRELEIHHLADFSVTGPDNFVQLSLEAGLPYDVVIHDYLSICPRTNLAGPDGLYCGEPDETGCRRCLKRNGSEYGNIDIAEWRKRYTNLLTRARTVIAPHEDLQRRLFRYFPDVVITVRNHETIDPAPPRNRRQAEGEPYRIGTLGAISPIKGLSVLRACARDAAKRGLPLKFVVVGYTSNDRKSEGAGIEVTGRYLNNRVLEEIDAAGLDLIFLASTWPEVWAYTLSRAMEAGLPIAAFDIGAIGMRIHEERRMNGILFPLELANRPAAINDRLISLFEVTDKKSRLGGHHPNIVETTSEP